MLLGFISMLPGVAATLSAMLGAIALLPRDRSRQHMFFGLLNLGTYCWSLSYFLGFGATALFDSSQIQSVGWALFVLGQIGVVLATTSWLLFSFETVGRHDWTRGWRLLLVCTPGTILLLSMVTDPWHGLFVAWADWSQKASFAYGPLGNVLTIVILGLMLIGPAVYIHGALHTRYKARRRLFALLSVAGFIPLVGSAVWITRGLSGIELPFNPTVVLFTLMNLLLGVAVFRAGLLDIVPVAERGAFRSMRDASVVVDMDGYIAVMNDSFARVFSAARVGIVLEQAAPSLAVHCEVRSPLQGVEGAFPFELSGRVYQVRVSRMVARAGKPLGDLIVLTDVTEEQAAQQRILNLNASLERSVLELEQATKLKDRFIADMSHELRTPLQSIIGFAGTLQRELPGALNPQQHEHVAVILDAGRHLASLIESLLDLSRIESGVMVAAARRFDVNEVAHRVIDTMRPLAKRRGVELGLVECADVLCTVHSDETKYRQILINLLGNAVKFTKHGRVELAVSYGGDHVVFRVSDTGPGISEADLPHVFDAFYQGDIGASSRARGTGLGLYVSATLARLLGGSISVESTLGNGTTFTVRLPTELPVAELDAIASR